MRPLYSKIHPSGIVKMSNFILCPKVLIQYKQLLFTRKGKYRPATPTAPVYVTLTELRLPPWILKQGGVEISGRKLSHLMAKLRG